MRHDNLLGLSTEFIGKFLLKIPPTREQIRFLHFHWMKGIPYAKAAKVINKVYGPRMVGRTTAYEWYGRFEEDGLAIKDRARTGRPREMNYGAIIQAVRDNPTLTTRILAEEFHCRHSTVAGVLHDEGKFSKG